MASRTELSRNRSWARYDRPMVRCVACRWLLMIASVAVLMGAGVARAQQTVGISDDALAGYGHVGVFDARKPSLSIAGTAGFGLIEAQPTTTGSTTRWMGRLALGVQATEWFAASLYLDGRYDAHADDAMGADDSIVGDPEFRFRAGTTLDSGLMLGAEASVWVPGRDAPSVEFSALTVQLKALLGYRFGDLTLAANLGFRLDNSANAIDQPEQLRAGDRISLGLSDFHALPLGVALAYTSDALEVFGAVHLSMLLGDVPAFMNSPFGADLGIRYALADSFGLELRSEVSFSSRPTQGPNDALIRIDPRFAVFAGLRYGLGFADEPALQTTEEEPVTPTVDEPKTGTLRGILRSDTGQPLANAEVTVRVGDVERVTSTDAEGNYEIGELPLGKGTLRVVAEGYDERSTPIEVAPGVNSPADLELTESTPSGQLRGLIRSFAGQGVKAKISVSPGDISLDSEQDGSFQVDIAPGSYEVTIEARGYASQTRSVSIDENGVTVLNVELRKSR